MNNKSFEELMNGYVNNQLTDKEAALFLELVQQGKYEERLQDSIAAMLHNRSVTGLSDEKRADIILGNIMAAAEAKKPLPVMAPVTEKRSARRVLLMRALAAAAIICIASVIYLWKYPSPKPQIANTQKAKGQYTSDVLPGGQKAILTLANGAVIALDDAKNGTLAKQGTAKIVKLDGKINYETVDVAGRETFYNTIATPPGGQYRVVLPDGTGVWLNATSSIHFPTAFNGSERTVDISGEVYFEVAKNKDKPFIVNVNGSQVKVFGTHFNVMAYADEGVLATTLFEGSVAFSNSGRIMLLEPLQQSRLLKSGKLDMIKNADAEDVLAWKNGMFHFDSVDIQTVMRQLSRWYDVEVEYRAALGHDLYDLEMPRNSKLSSVLKVLEIMGNIHFDIKGRTIIIS